MIEGPDFYYLPPDVNRPEELAAKPRLATAIGIGFATGGVAILVVFVLGGRWVATAVERAAEPRSAPDSCRDAR